MASNVGGLGVYLVNSPGGIGEVSAYIFDVPFEVGGLGVYIIEAEAEAEAPSAGSTRTFPTPLPETTTFWQSQTGKRKFPV